MQSWLEGRIWVGKGAQATGMTASLRIQSSKADSNTCESFTRSGLKLESVHQESPRSDVFRKRAQEERRGTDSMLLEVQCEVSSQWWFGLPCHLLVLVHCVFWSPETTQPFNYLNYFSLCALNLFNTRVSQFELNYWNKWTFPRHSNLLRCICTVCVFIYA